MRISQSLCLNAPFRFFSDALWSSSFREQRLYGNFFLQLENQRLLYKKFVDTLADPQCWMCALISSMWRRLKERSMSLEILLSYQPPCNCTQHSSALLQSSTRAEFILCLCTIGTLPLYCGWQYAYRGDVFWPCWCSQQPVWENYL